jgi:hypothetical protein
LPFNPPVARIAFPLLPDPKSGVHAQNIWFTAFHTDNPDAEADGGL